MTEYEKAIDALKNGKKVEYEGNIMKMQGGKIYCQKGFMYTNYLSLYCKNRTGFKILS